ncbi:hypothetical protein K7432_008795 [Basidiobolus ranarum]|uniref:REM-1 domain-containing protein n=1 Tax=Basidiobolus ranarum TaxID=34480 RepID=A0ABR2WRB5_9FUNG
MFVHKNSQQTHSPGLGRSEYVKPRQHESKSAATSTGPTNNGQGQSTNSEDICFTSYSSFTVKPKSIKPMDLRDLQIYSLPTTPEKKRFSNLSVSTLVSPMASLFNLDKKSEGSKSPEFYTVCGARYDTMDTSEHQLVGEESDPFLKKSTEFPKPSIDSILEGFYIHDGKANAREMDGKSLQRSNERLEMISSVLFDTKDFNALNLDEYRLLKQEYLEYNVSIEALKTKLQHEIKIRDGASSMVNAQTDRKLMEQAQEQLSNSERRVDQLSSELWRVTQIVAHLQRTFLEHIGAVLAESIRQRTDAPVASVLASRPREAQLSRSQSVEDVSINDISDLSTQLTNISYKLEAFVKSHSEARPLHGDLDVYSGSGPVPEFPKTSPDSSLGDKDQRIQELTMQVARLQEELKETKEMYTNPVKSSHPIEETVKESPKQQMPQEKRGFRRQAKKRHSIITQDLNTFDEEDKDQMIYKLRLKVEEYSTCISQLNEEKAELLSSLRLLYLHVPDLSLSRDSSISSKEESGIDVEKLGRRIDQLIQENHKLLDRVVNLQHKNQRLRKDRSETISRKDGLHGIYQSGNLDSNLWLEESSSDEKSSTSLSEKGPFNSLGMTLQNQ